MNTVQQMEQEIRDAIANGEDLDDIRDRAGEFVDSYLPVYNGEIIAEWQNMPSEYDNRGAAELGHLDHEINIVNLMSLDLYLYYSDLLIDAIAVIAQEMKEGQGLSR
jgi:hypothetical protein